MVIFQSMISFTRLVDVRFNRKKPIRNTSLPLLQQHQQPLCVSCKHFDPYYELLSCKNQLLFKKKKYIVLLGCKSYFQVLWEASKFYIIFYPTQNSFNYLLICLIYAYFKQRTFWKTEFLYIIL